MSSGPEDDRGFFEEAARRVFDPDVTLTGEELEEGDPGRTSHLGIAQPAGGLGAFSRVGSQAMAGSGLVQRLGSVATSAGRLAWPSRGATLSRTRRAGAGLGAAITAGHAFGDASPDGGDGAAGPGGDEANTGLGGIVSGHRDDDQGAQTPAPAPSPTDPLANPEVARNEQISQARFGQSIEREAAEALELQEQIAGQSDPSGEVVVDFEGIPRRDATPITESPEQAVSHILNADERWLKNHQQKLYAAGFYDESFEEIRWGFPGPETQRAALQFMRWAAGFEEDGEKVVWHRALDKIADESGGFEEPEDPEAPRDPVQLSDPASVGQMADKLYRNIAGRKATDEEKRAAVAMIHRLQREKSQQIWDARVNEISGAEVEQVDPASRIAEQVEETAPEDVMDVDVREAAEGFRRTIGGR